MSMLAGPRRKQKVINLRAKNNEWSKDANKFGQRMLEKMGWTSGKGLGANENGIVEHVVARYKNDEKGLGFEDRNDQWTKHEDDFNSLLANLSNANDDDGLKLHSGISLEDKSKKSKARIHYHKFTRGKDLSRYSEKDLANIFGKKSFKQEDVTESPAVNHLKTTEQVFTEKGSMEDYFKNKMVAIKAKNKTSCTENVQQDLDWEDEPRCAFQGFLGAADNNGVLENENSALSCELINNLDNGGDVNDLGILPKSKKKKKNKFKEDFSDELCEKTEDVPQKVKKLKKKQKVDTENHIQKSDVEMQNYSEKRKQDKVVDIEEHDIDVSLNIPKKKKKRKNKDLSNYASFQ